MTAPADQEKEVLRRLKELAPPLTATRVRELPLSKLDTRHRVQVRNFRTPDQWAPSASVMKIANAMESVEFPAILVTSDYWVIDGNTRVGARLKRKLINIPAFVLDDVRWEEADPDLQKDLVILGATLNSSVFAEPLPARVLRDRVQDALSRGYTISACKERFHLTEKQITALRKEQNAASKLKAAGGRPSDQTVAALQSLGTPGALELHNAPFVALATLVSDAGLTAKEITDTVADLRSMDSDQAQIAALNVRRDELAAQIQARSIYGKVAGIPDSRRLRQYLGNVTKYAGTERKLVETNPAFEQAHVEVLETAISVLKKALALQQRQQRESVA